MSGQELPGTERRDDQGPVLRKGVGIPTSGWFDPRGRALGGFAFAWGKRQRGDGSVDLWAELARPGH